MSDTVLIALFSGINVGGNRIVKMEALRGLFAKTGYPGAQSYVQSGNVVFHSGDSPEVAATRIDKAFEREFGFRSIVLVRDAKQWRMMIDANPFAGQAEDPTKVHALILEAEPPASAYEALAAVKTDGEAFVAGKGVLYLSTPNGLGRSKFATRIGPTIKTHFSQRNWRTVLALRDLAAKAAE